MKIESEQPERDGSPEKFPLTLSPADAAIVDQLLDRPAAAPLGLASSNHTAATPAPARPDPQRVARVREIMATLGAMPQPQAPADLVSRTLATVKNDTLHLHGPDRGPGRAQEPAEGQSMNLSRRLSQFGAVAVAASILIAVLIPGLGELRARAYVTACTSNLDHLQTAFAAYAAANNGALPKLADGDGNWLPHPDAQSTQGHSNTANLLPLIQGGLVKETLLICPGRGGSLTIDANARDISDVQRGYSYANMFGATHASWDRKNTTIVLADRNPLFAPDAADDAQSNSCNHRYKGTNVLSADGSVSFAATPDIGPHGDNIWTLMEGQSFRRHYTGTELIQSADDVFLAP